MSQRYFHDEFACSLHSDYADEDKHNSPILTKNCKYRDNLTELQKQDGNNQDARHMYTRAWFQVVNLAFGCVVLGMLIRQRK